MLVRSMTVVEEKIEIYLKNSTQLMWMCDEAKKRIAINIPNLVSGLVFR